MCKNVDKYLEQIQKVSPFYNNVNHRSYKELRQEVCHPQQYDGNVACQR